MHKISVLAATAALLVSSAFAQQGAAPPSHGIQVDNIDRKIKPGDDFYMFANGAWIARTELPPDRAGIGVFSQLAEKSRENTQTIIKQAAEKKGAPGSEPQKIADLYASYMNEDAIEKRGMAPVQPMLDRIAAIKTRKELSEALGRTIHNDVDALNNTNFHTMNLFGLWVVGGFNDPSQNAAYLLQGGGVLPDREYYLSDSKAMQGIRAAYKPFVSRMLGFAGVKDADAAADKVIALETAIAKVHRSLEENEDVQKANNVWTVADFTTKAPGADWPALLKAAQLGGVQRFIVWQPEAFTGEAKLVGSEDIETWKQWLMFHTMMRYAGTLPKNVADAQFAFFGTTMTGVKVQRPRDVRAVAVVNGVLGDAIGRIYAEKYFPASSKAEAQAMVTNIIAAFDARLASNDWMAASTREEARKKLKTLYVGIGYPETWKDYSTLTIKADDLFGNVQRAGDWSYRQDVAKIGKPADRHMWTMEPQTVNAVNLPLQNALNFPAAILQPPFFDPQAPAAANYGAIGTIIGHEISHTFDTEGSAFDSEGKVRNWWTQADLDHFHKVTDALAAQFDQYTPFPDLHVNGKQTLAENIADNGGLSASYDAYKASLKGAPAPQVGGYTGDQQYYIAFAQNYGSKQREAALRAGVAGDPHAPGMYRALEVRNMDPWYAAFDVKPDQKEYLPPDKRVRVW